MVDVDTVKNSKDESVKYMVLFYEKKEYPYYIVENNDNMVQQFIGSYSSADTLIKNLDLSYVKRIIKLILNRKMLHLEINFYLIINGSLEHL